MAKKRHTGIKLFSLLIFILINLSVVFLYLPYHFYKTVLKQGLNTEYLKMEGLSYNKTLLAPLAPLPSSSDGESLNNKWGKFHYRDFLIPLPIRHPEYITLPFIEHENGNELLGLKFKSTQGDELMTFIQEKPYRANFSRGNNKIFFMPIYEQKLLKLTPEDLWSELFSKNISSDFLWAKSPVEIAQFFLDFKHEDLVYNLYILYLRQNFFSKDIKSIRLETLRNIGIVEKEGQLKNKSIKEEKWYFFYLGTIYPMRIRYNQFQQSAIRAKNEIFLNIQVVPSSEASSVTLYNEFQALPFKRKIDQEGMIYLMSAWTHVLENKNFLRQMIQFLERGEQNALYLAPLYEYSLRTYGTSFSKTSEEFRGKEGEMAKLERKGQEELQKELRETLNQGPDKDGNFKNDQDKVNFFLKKAKESGIDTDFDE